MDEEYPTFCLACPWETLTNDATGQVEAPAEAWVHGVAELDPEDCEPDPACVEEVDPCSVGSKMTPVDGHDPEDHDHEDFDQSHHHGLNRLELAACACLLLGLQNHCVPFDDRNDYCSCC